MRGEEGAGRRIRHDVEFFRRDPLCFIRLKGSIFGYDAFRQRLRASKLVRSPDEFFIHLLFFFLSDDQSLSLLSFSGKRAT